MTRTRLTITRDDPEDAASAASVITIFAILLLVLGVFLIYATPKENHGGASDIRANAPELGASSIPAIVSPSAKAY